MSFKFQITHRDGAARRGVMTTAHGEVPTPMFMPVGTQGAVKAVTARDLQDAGVRIILGNTYHLFLRPGDGLIARRGGLHTFIGWPYPILTDSGGYQVFSLAERRTITEEGVTFRSHLDGSAHHLTPERAVDIQSNLGSDISMALDECPPHPSPSEALDRSLEMTARWARRCRERLCDLKAGAVPAVAVTNPGQVQFGIVQGGVDLNLRAKSAELTVALGFDGYAIGGVSVGEPNDDMHRVVDATAPRLPEGRPRYLMGVGTPPDIIESVHRGIDLFDCVLPTRNARNGQLFTRQGPLNIKNARYAEDDRPLDEACRCYTCRHFSRAYLRHLFHAGEMTGSALNTLHNLHFYLDTMERIREAISFGTFETFRQDFHRTYSLRPLIP
jgi:queuine tRNA-ribosyltransferase